MRRSPGFREPADGEFASAEDADLVNLSDADYWALYRQWLLQAQATNERDRHVYSHGVMLVEPGYEHLLPEMRAGTL